METTEQQQQQQPDNVEEIATQQQGQESIPTPSLLKKGKLGQDDALIRETNNKTTGYTSYTLSEKKTFVRYVNDVMKSDTWQPIEPLDPNNQLIERMKDGRVLCKLINHACPGTIDAKVISEGENVSKFKIAENISYALKAAKELGFIVVNVGQEDFQEGKLHAILSMLWQTMRQDLLKSINLANTVQVIALKREDESVEQFMSLKDKDILLRWVNYQLKKDGKLERVVENFSTDFQDSLVYARVLRVVAPHVISEEDSHKVEEEQDMMKRAELIIEYVKRLNPEQQIFIDAEDIVNGNSNMNTAYLASIFNTCIDSSLATPETEDPQKMLELRSKILEIAIESVAKDLPSVRSSKFTQFIQAAKNLTTITRSSISDSKIMQSLKQVQEEAYEIKQNSLKLEASLEVTQSELNQAKQILETAQQLNASLQQELGTSHSTAAQLTAQTAALESALQTTKDELQEKTTSLETLQQSNASLQQELLSTKEQAAQTNEKLSQVESTLQSTQGELEEKKNTLSITQTELQSTTQAKEQLTEQVQSLESNLQQTQTKLQDTESTLQTATQELSSTKIELEQTSQKLTQTSEELKQKIEVSEQLTSSLEQTQTKLQETETELQSTKNVVQEKQTALEQKEQAMQTQEVLFEAEKKALQEIYAELEKLKQIEQEDYESRIRALEAENRELKSKLEESEKKRQALMDNLAEAQDALNKSRTQNEQFKEEKEITQRKTKDLVSRIVKLKQALVQTRKDLDYGVSMGGKDAETKLAIFRFGKIDCMSLDSPKCTRVGFLFKQGGKVKSWKKRYFVLIDNYLFYYKSTKDLAPKGFLRTDDCVVEDVSKELDRKFTFKVTVQSRVFYASGDSEKEMTEWMFDIRQSGNIDEIVT